MWEGVLGRGKVQCTVLLQIPDRGRKQELTGITAVGGQDLGAESTHMLAKEMCVHGWVPFCEPIIRHMV